MSVGLSRTAIFSISLAISSETLEMRPVLVHSDTQFVVGFSVIPKCVTLIDLEWLFRVKFSFRTSLVGWKTNCMKSNTVSGANPPQGL